MAYNNKLRFRDSKKEFVFHGKFGNEDTGVFDYTDGGKALGEFSEVEVLAFHKCHNKATIERLMIGQPSTTTTAQVSAAPKDKK